MKYPARIHLDAMSLRAQGFTQVDVARRLKVHPRTLRRWERQWRERGPRAPAPLPEIGDDLWEMYHEEQRATLKAKYLLGALRASVAQADDLRRQQTTRTGPL
jgi:transposase-like protein